MEQTQGYMESGQKAKLQPKLTNSASLCIASCRLCSCNNFHKNVPIKSELGQETSNKKIPRKYVYPDTQKICIHLLCDQLQEIYTKFLGIMPYIWYFIWTKFPIPYNNSPPFKNNVLYIILQLNVSETHLKSWISFEAHLVNIIW